MKKVFIVFFCLFINVKTNAQSNDAEALLYNVSIGGVFGTIGSIINKKPNEKIDKVILKGLSQGILGGYLTFESKRLLREAAKHEDWKYYWSSKIVNSAGNSVIENAAMNRNFWEQWNLNIGFMRFEYHLKEDKKIHPKIMPIGLVYTIGVALQTKFELNKSLQSGQFIFSSNHKDFNTTNSIGITYPGVIVLKTENKNQYSLRSHEIVHIYQQNDFMVLNIYLNKPLNKWIKKSKFINKYVYFDLHYIPASIIHSIESKNSIEYYDNFLEHEAAYFSNTLR